MASPFVSSLVNDYGSKHPKQFGENGAVELTPDGVKGESSREVEGHLVVAFSGILRGVDNLTIRKYVDSVFRSTDAERSDLEDFLSMVFHCRECRGDGKGEKMVFYHLLFSLYNYVPKTVCRLLQIVPEYGYWKDYQNLIELSFTTYKDLDGVDTLRNHIYRYWVEQLSADMDTLKRKSGNISLCSKYFPKEGRSLDRKYRVCEVVARQYFDDHQTLRDTILKRMRKEVLSPLNKEIGLIERLMSQNLWDTINFSLVPGRCLSINRKAFLNVNKDNSMRHPENEVRMTCRNNLTEHMEGVKCGLGKINGKQLFIHEIMGKFFGGDWGTNINSLSEEEITLLELQWNDHRDYYKDMISSGSGLDKTMVLADFSGSMAGVPMRVSAAIAIMVSSLLPKPWNNKFITFDTAPQLLEIPEGKLVDKVKYVLNSPWGGTTNFMAAIELIINVGVDHGLSRDQMPDKLVVISDMQFDFANKAGRTGMSYPVLEQYSNRLYPNMANYGEPTTHEIIVEAFSNAGRDICGEPWTPPTMVYWDVRSSSGGFPVKSDTPNTQMLSGFSLALLKLVLDNKDTDGMKEPTPYDTFLRAVKSDKYDEVRDIVREVGEAPYFMLKPGDDWEKV